MDKSSPETDLAGPIFVLNSTEYCMDTTTTGFASFRSFTKVLTFRDSFYVPAKGSPISSLQNYPFDR
jgi:hypothetical protein